MNAQPVCDSTPSPLPPPPLFIGGVGIFEGGGGVGGKHGFSLVMYGFCSSNAFHSVCLIFIFIYLSFNFILTPFVT